MNRKSLALVTSLVLAGPLMAQESATTTPATQTSSVEAKSMFQQLKDSPLDFTFNLDTSTEKADNTENYKINGYTQTNRFYLGYKLTAQDKVRTELRTTHTKQSNTDMNNSVNRAVLKYSRSGMLKQDTHGVDLSSSVEYRYLPDTALRNSNHRYSHVRLGPTVAKAWGNFAADMGAFFAFNQTRNSDKVDREVSNWFFPVSQSFNFTEKLKSSLTEELAIPANASNKEESTTLDLTAEVGYQFNQDFYIGFSVAGRPSATPITKNGKAAGGNTDWAKKISYGVNFDVAVF